ncbi:hypothetical protein [Novacetimonas hansenii]|uniref:hypothetical protein n=1 Tax=Novacetimonas hansenii TaxID=436 RepID=UPI003C2E3384
MTTPPPDAAATSSAPLPPPVPRSPTPAASATSVPAKPPVSAPVAASSSASASAPASSPTPASGETSANAGGGVNADVDTDDDAAPDAAATSSAPPPPPVPRGPTPAASATSAPAKQPPVSTPAPASAPASAPVRPPARASARVPGPAVDAMGADNAVADMGNSGGSAAGMASGVPAGIDIGDTGPIYGRREASAPQTPEAQAHPYIVSDQEESSAPLAAPATDITSMDAQRTQAIDAETQRLAHATAIFDLLLEEGHYWLAHHDMVRAHETVHRALQIDPENTDALFLQGRIQVGRGEFADATRLANELARHQGVADEVAQLRGMIRTGPVNEKLLAEARALVAQGKMHDAMVKYREIFGHGEPPPELAMEYYRILGGTPLGYQEARTKLADYVARNPHDLDAALTYYQVLTYQAVSRTDGMAGLERLMSGHVPAGIHTEAMAAWRGALLWEPVAGQTIPGRTIPMRCS